MGYTTATDGVVNVSFRFVEFVFFEMAQQSTAIELCNQKVDC